MAWEYVVLHHSLTKDNETVSWGAIRTYHTSNLGWSDIGYHWGVENINGHYEILVGRTMSQTGAHTKEMNMNTQGIGICCVGNFDVEPPPDTQLISLSRIVTWLMKEYKIPQEHIIGHRDAGPGSMFNMEHFKSLLPPFS